MSKAAIEHALGRVVIQDHAAFARLYDMTSAKLFGVCWRVLKDRAEAEEALKDIYLIIWDRADLYRADGLDAMTWLITVARNHAVARLRARQAQSVGPSGATGSDAADAPDSDLGPEALFIASHGRSRLMNCLEELPEARAQAIQRAYLDGDSYAELAAHFDVQRDTMRTGLRRSLMSLRECLSR